MTVVVKHDDLQSMVDFGQAVNVNLNASVQRVCGNDENLRLLLKLGQQSLRHIRKNIRNANGLIVKAEGEFF